MWEVNHTVEEVPVNTTRFEAAYFDGIYFQPAGPEECSCRQEAIRDKIAAGCAGDITLREYQDWAELSWRLPHGTYKTGLHWTEKFLEEGPKESVEELAKLAPRSEQEDSSGETLRGVEELGDTLWTLVANASNGGIDLEVVMAEKLRISMPITLSRMQEVIQRSPLWAPYWLDVNPEEMGTAFVDRDELDPEITLTLSAVQIRGLTHELFGYGDNDIFTPPLRDTQARFADVHADALLLLCYDMHQWTRSDLAKVVEVNFAKLEDRVRNNTLDKLHRSD